MKIPKKVKIKFLCPMFDIRVWLYVGDSRLFKEFEDKKDLNTRTGALYKVEKDTGSTEFIVWIKDKKDFFTIVHETLHLVREIFKLVDIKFKSNNDEIIAYYQGYWVKKFWNKMNK